MEGLADGGTLINVVLAYFLLALHNMCWYLSCLLHGSIYQLKTYDEIAAIIFLWNCVMYFKQKN